MIKIKKIIDIIIISILLIGIINTTYADTPPSIGENQAKMIAQKYLNNHGLSYYKAKTPVPQDWRVKVKDTKTGKTKWIPYLTYRSDYKGDNPFDDTTIPRYNIIFSKKTVGESIKSRWFVPVYHHGKKVGTVYVSTETGKVWGSSFKKKLKQVNSPKLDMNVPKSVITEEGLDGNVSEGVNVGVPMDVAPVHDDVNKSGFPFSEPVKRFAFPLLCLGLLSGGIYWYFKK